MLLEKTSWTCSPHLWNGDGDNTLEVRGLEEKHLCSPAMTGNRGAERCLVQSHAAGRWPGWDLNSGHRRADPVKSFYDTVPLSLSSHHCCRAANVIVMPETPRRSLPHLQSVFWLARYSLHPWYSESFQWCALMWVFFPINWSECLLCPLFLEIHGLQF